MDVLITFDRTVDLPKMSCYPVFDSWGSVRKKKYNHFMFVLLVRVGSSIHSLYFFMSGLGLRREKEES